MKIAIIGAGVIGISSAVRLQAAFPQAKVIIYAEKVSPDTTSDVAAGLWYPYAISEDQKEIEKWCRATYSFLSYMVLNDPKHHKYGIFLQDLMILTDTDNVEISLAHKIFCNTRLLNEAELNMFGSCKNGVVATTFMTQAIKLMPYLVENFISKGGKIIQMRVQDFDDIQVKENYPIVINCSGLGARELCNDMNVHPLRGQIIKVEAPWVKYALSYKSAYILPQSDGTVILGGTKQKDNYNLSPDDADTKEILNNCYKLMSGLKESKILEIKVGLRPYRCNVRLETENKINRQTGESYKIIHNYGHGGSGLTLFWGCAENVVDLVKKCNVHTRI